MNNKKNNIISIEKSSAKPSSKVSDSAKPTGTLQPSPNPNFVPPPAKKNKNNEG